MERYFYIILLAIKAFGHNIDHIGIPVNSAEIFQNVDDINLDQNTASGNINSNSYYSGVGVLNYVGENYGNRYNGRYFAKDVEDMLFDEKLSEREKFERHRGLYEHYEFDDGNPDVYGRIQRPCQAYDTFCIRKFFAEHSQCQISGRQTPDPLYRAQSTINLPSVNITATLLNVEYKGIKDGKIQEFFIDKATDNLVISVMFDQITYVSQNVNFKYHLRGREPIVTRDAAGGTFVRVSVTAVIPSLKDLKLDRAEIYTYSEEPVPPLLGSPRLALSSDPEVVAMFAKTLTNAPIDVREALLTEGIFFISNFIQYNICDFGLKAI